MAELFYTPTEPPSTPFALGDVVDVLDRDHAVISRQTVTKASKRRVTTSCGRTWTQQGEWFDGQRGYPFPSIRKTTSGVALPDGGQKK